MTQPNPPAEQPPKEEPPKETPPKEEPPKETPPKEEPPEETPPEGGDVIDIKSVLKDADGNFVFIVNPDDPKSTVYKGATFDEMMTNAAKGIQEKDTYINKLKSQGLVAEKAKPGSPAGPGLQRRGAAPEAPKFAEYGSILEQVLKENRIDPQFLQYTDDDWKKLEDEHGVRKVMQIENAVNAAKKEADRRYGAESAKIINEQTLDEEEATIKELLEAYSIPESEFAPKYLEILDEINGDDKNFKNGVRKAGRVVGAAMKAMKSMVEPGMRKAIEEDIAKNRVIKANIKPDGKSAKGGPSEPEKDYKSTEDAMNDILKDIRAKHKL